MSELSKVDEDVNKEEDTEEEEAFDEGSSNYEEEEPNGNLLNGKVSKSQPSVQGPAGDEMMENDLTLSAKSPRLGSWIRR